MLDYDFVMRDLKIRGKSIGYLATMGVASAQKVVEMYNLHYTCPGDPGGKVLLIVAYEEFLNDYNENHLPPNLGGCWFCYRKDKQEDMVFDTEFDTYLHLSCLKKTLELEPKHPEANIMKYFLEI